MVRIIFAIVQIALLTGIVFVSGTIFQKQRTTEDLEQLPPAAEFISETDKNVPEVAKSYNRYNAIAKRNLFQTPEAEIPSDSKIDLAALKPTELKLKLWGTITGEDGLARAVIEDQTRKEQAFFRNGEEVASAKIKMILREKVVLSVNGEDQILEIEEPAGIGGPGIAPRPASMTSHIRPLATSTPQPAQASPSRRAIRMKLDRLGPISDNPEDWGNDATAEPYQSEEGESGLLVNRITPSSPLRRLGIRNGDVVVSINNEPVDELSDIFDSLLNVSAGEIISLTLKRRGRVREIDFQFE